MTEKITAADAIRLLDSGKAVAVDVREPDEYAVGHIPGAKLLPLGQVIDRELKVTNKRGNTFAVRCSLLCSIEECQRRINDMLAEPEDAL